MHYCNTVWGISLMFSMKIRCWLKYFKEAFCFDVNQQILWLCVYNDYKFSYDFVRKSERSQYKVSLQSKKAEPYMENVVIVHHAELTEHWGIFCVVLGVTFTWICAVTKNWEHPFIMLIPKDYTNWMLGVWVTSLTCNMIQTQEKQEARCRWEDSSEVACRNMVWKYWVDVTDWG
jgi:hypothetical protein